MPPQNGYGYASYYTPPKVKPQTSPLALAASGSASAQNPFGLSAANGMRDAQGGYSPQAPVSAAAAAARPAVVSAAQNPTVPANPHAAQAAAPPSAPTPGGYDINTDPTLQGITALTGMGDQQANSSALAQKQQLLESYGSPDLAQAVLGDANVANVAKGNPTSTLAQLAQQRDTNEHNLTEQLNQNNLLYSGYRVNQEQQAATDYQNQLANAASSVNSGLNTISGNLAAALGQNQQQRVQAQTDAANRLAAAAAAAAGQAPVPAPAAPGGADTGAPVYPNSPHDLPAQGVDGGAAAAAPAPSDLAAAVTNTPTVTRQYAPNVPYASPTNIPDAARALASMFSAPVYAPRAPNYQAGRNAY